MVSQVVHTNNPADSTKSLTDIYANSAGAGKVSCICERCKLA
jgi:hypothetical protein